MIPFIFAPLIFGSLKHRNVNAGLSGWAVKEIA